MKLISRLHRFIAWDFRIGAPSRSRFSFFIGLIPLAPAAFLVWQGAGNIAILSLCAVLSLAWYGFVAWRLARMCRRHSILADRCYDRQGKYELPTEYSETDSATETARRKRRKASGLPPL